MGIPIPVFVFYDPFIVVLIKDREKLDCVDVKLFQRVKTRGYGAGAIGVSRAFFHEGVIRPRPIAFVAYPRRIAGEIPYMGFIDRKICRRFDVAERRKILSEKT